jgi:hypothetical protein
MMPTGGQVKTSQRLVWNLYAGAVAALTTVAAAKAVSKVWELSTGEAPPQPTDPEVPLRRALTWVAASALAMGLAQVLVNRFAASQWTRVMGTPAPGSGRADRLD